MGGTLWTAGWPLTGRALAFGRLVYIPVCEAGMCISTYFHNHPVGELPERLFSFKEPSIIWLVSGSANQDQDSFI